MVVECANTGTVIVFKHNYKSFDTPTIGSLDLNFLHWNLDELITLWPTDKIEVILCDFQGWDIKGD